MSWYVIRTKSGRELQAQEHLQRQDYPTYLPRILTRVRRFGRRVQTATPLFPQYLFLNLEVGVKDLAPVKSTQGVAGIVRFGEEYAVVHATVISTLRAQEDAAGFRPERSLLTPQCKVRITGGAFFGLEGIYLNESPRDRVTVLLNLLGRETALKIPERLVELCS